MKKVFFSFLLLSVIFFSSALSAIESVKVVPDDAFGFIAVNFQFDGFMDKILTLQEKYTDDDFMRAITQMKETFGFSPMEKKFLKNFNSTTFILLKSEDLKRNPRVGVIVDLKDPDLFKQYLDKLKTNVKNKKDISVYPCNKAKFPVTIFEKKGKDKEVLYTAFFNNIFAVGIGKDEGLQVLVDLQERAARNSFSIDKNKSFQKLVSHFPINSPIYAYMSGEMAKADMSYELPSIAKTDNLIEGSAISINYQDGTISSDGYVLFKESKNNPLNIYLKSNTQPLKSSTILPEGTLLYLAGRFMIPQEVFKKIEFADAISKINNGLGVDFRTNYLPVFKQEYGQYIYDRTILPDQRNIEKSKCDFTYDGTTVTPSALIEMLNKGVTPFVCQKGSVGASGDLAPMSQVALLLMGEGEACITPYSETKCMDGLKCKLLSETPHKNGVCVKDNESLISN